MDRRDGIFDSQRARIALFPKGRIPFKKGSWEAARADIRTRRSFFAGEIDIETCCEQVARNNYLDEVKQNDLICFWRKSGWIL